MRSRPCLLLGLFLGFGCFRFALGSFAFLLGAFFLLSEDGFETFCVIFGFGHAQSHDTHESSSAIKNLKMNGTPSGGFCRSQRENGDRFSNYWKCKIFVWHCHGQNQWCENKIGKTHSFC